METVESMAWKLLFDNKTDPLSARMLLFSEEQDDDQTTFTFEVLLNIMMELIFGMLKIEWLKFCENKKLTEFNPKFTVDDFENVIPALKQKFAKINYLISIYEIEEFENQYCRIMLRKQDFVIFLNPKFEKVNKLDDVFAVCKLDEKTYRIKFSSIGLGNH